MITGAERRGHQQHRTGRRAACGRNDRQLLDTAVTGECVRRAVIYTVCAVALPDDVERSCQTIGSRTAPALEVDLCFLRPCRELLVALAVENRDLHKAVLDLVKLLVQPIYLIQLLAERGIPCNEER